MEMIYCAFLSTIFGEILLLIVGFALIIHMPRSRCRGHTETSATKPSVYWDCNSAEQSATYYVVLTADSDCC